MIKPSGHGFPAGADCLAVLTSPAVGAASDLQSALRGLGIEADVTDGYGLAVVSVWVGLLVWCNGERFWWRSGWDERRKRPVYAWHPACDPERAARRVAFRYRDLRRTRPLAALRRGECG
ncbi:hypothetical protein [Thermoactinospora rubra]|uniref:hypothetical protein n=1 Tax=Thermoactinospora rubra TaxID=1088767 RepID=UPI00117EA5C4|nr:hypothetical protein [Thermoactinospora rubra]